jgi:SAM-dependent methyltransferase
MLEHAKDPKACLEEMNRVLKPNGVLIITVPFNNEMHSKPHDYWRFTKYGMDLILRESGFRIDKTIQRGDFRICLGQMKIRYMIDKFNPYEDRKWMILLSPLSRVYTSYVLRSTKKPNEAALNHALGWCIRAHKMSGEQ